MTSQELQDITAECDSSAISSYTYNSVEEVIDIRFTNGGEFEFNCDPDTFMAFHLAGSKGRAFHELFRGQS
jgi:hypothetical protein